MYRNVAVNWVPFLESFDCELVSNAIIREHLILLQSDDFTNTHAGINAETKESLIASGFQYLGHVVYLFESKNFCLTGHACNEVDENLLTIHFVYVKRLTFFVQALERRKTLTGYES